MAVRYVSLIEIKGKASLYAGYEEDVEKKFLESFEALSDDEKDEIDYDWASEVTDGDIDSYLEDSWDGWSFANENLSIRVVYDDGEEEVFEVKKLNEKEGKTYEPVSKLIRHSYSKRVVGVYNLEDDMLEIEGNFDIDKLSFVVNNYSVNEDEFSTFSQLDYDGSSIYFSEAPDGCSEEWTEFSVMYNDEVYTF